MFRASDPEGLKMMKSKLPHLDWALVVIANVFWRDICA